MSEFRNERERRTAMKRAYETVTAELLAMEQADIITSSGEGDPLTKYENPNQTEWDKA